MNLIAVPLTLMGLSLGTILVIVIRKFPQLSVLDVENLPEVKESKRKNEVIRKRVERLEAEGKKERQTRWIPFFRLLRHVQLGFRQYVGRIERLVSEEMNSMRPRMTNRGRSAVKENKQMPGERVRTALQEAVFLLDQGDFEGAEKKYLALIRQNPKAKEAYRGLGDVYVKQGHMEEARETYQFVAQLDPWDDTVLVKLAEMAEAEGKLEQAVELYEQAVLLNDNLSGRFAKLAELLSTLGQYPTALEAIKQALDLEPENPKYLDMAVEVGILVGNKVFAEEAYQHLRMVNPENQKLPALKDKIEKMPP